MYDASYREFIKTLICNTAPPDPADLHKQTRIARTFARALNARERRYERAFHAGVFHAPTPPDAATSAQNVQEAISHLREDRKHRDRVLRPPAQKGA